MSGALLAFAVSMALTSAAHPQASDPSNAPLRPGDRLLVKIWLDTAFADTVRIDETGAAMLPRLGPMHITDLSSNAIADSVSAGVHARNSNPLDRSHATETRDRDRRSEKRRRISSRRRRPFAKRSRSPAVSPTSARWAASRSFATRRGSSSRSGNSGETQKRSFAQATSCGSIASPGSSETFFPSSPDSACCSPFSTRRPDD